MNHLTIWTIYESPSDFGGKFVAREFHVSANEAHATANIRLGNTLAEVRGKLPRGLVNLGREGGDERQIVESWI